MAGRRTPAIFSAAKPYSPSAIPKSQTALLLCDYQKITLAHLGDSASNVVSDVRSARDWALANNVVVYHCLVDTKTSPKPHLKMTDRWSQLAERLSTDPALADEPTELAPNPPTDMEQSLVRTPGYLSALKSHGILEDMHKRQIKSLLIGGISTSGCVLSTVKAASDHDFITTVIQDLCWDPKPAAHDILVNDVFTSAAHVATFEEVQKIWDH